MVLVCYVDYKSREKKLSTIFSSDLQNITFFLMTKESEL
jgi:hypothetical protein